MPSPLGHALGGLAAGWLVAGVPAARRELVRSPWRWPEPLRTQAALFAALGMAPDLDLLVGLHSTYTHSLGAALIVGLAAAALRHSQRPAWLERHPTDTLESKAAPRALRFGVACACAYATHVLFDWLGSDTTPPIGIMALWPWSDAFYQSDLHWFMAISRRYWLPTFWTHNLHAVAREVAWLGAIVAAVALWRSSRVTRQS